MELAILEAIKSREDLPCRYRESRQDVDAFSCLQEPAVALADSPLHCDVFSPLLSLLSMTPFRQSRIGKEPAEMEQSE